MSSAALLLAGLLAVAPNLPGVEAPQTTLDLINDLRHENPSRRLYAARELRRQARHALRDANARPGSLKADESLVALTLFDEKVAGICIDAVASDENIARQCADILGLLETVAARPALSAAAARADARGLQRALARALRRIEGANP
jgi:hypothetical protein